MADQPKRNRSPNALQRLKHRAMRKKTLHKSQRARTLESLEARHLMASDWQNPFVPRDVSGDGLVVPLDALLVINELNQPTVLGTGGRLPVLDPGTNPSKYFDTSGDNFVTPIDVLLVVNILNSDLSPPNVQASLANDTAPGGTTNSDGITSDAAIQGKVSDDRGVASLMVRVDGGAARPVTVNRDGTFTLDLGFAADGDDDGEHVVEFLATDPGQQVTAPVPLRFTFDTQPPTSAQLNLAPTSDGGTLGDRETNAANVTLVGQSEPNVFVTLSAQDETSVGNTLGTFQFPRIGLQTGDNNFVMQVSDRAGNTAEFSQVIRRSGDLPSEDMVLAWNRIALDSVARDASTPPQASRNLALVSVATYDALMAFQASEGIYTHLSAANGASAEAAAAAATHRVLSLVYPAQQAVLDAALEQTLSSVPAGDARNAGITLGRTAADQVLAVRANDGFNHVVEFDSGTAVGAWQPTAPMFDVALLPQWASVQPFAMDTSNQFRAPEPPSLASEAWTAAYEEVRQFGRAQGSQRTADQTQIARFWADGRGTDTPPGHWNRIASEVAVSAGNSMTVNARMLLELNFALADAAISSWDSKYAYNFWRPITAIQAGDSDGNPATQPDATWEPLLITPNFPEYTSGHSTFSGAAANVLNDIFGNDQSFSTTSWSLAGVTRDFSSFDAAAAEAGKSRIYGGIHYNFSSQAGLAAGKSIAGKVADRLSVSTDDQPPSIFLNPLPAGASLKVSPTLSGRVHDALSGVQFLEAKIDSGAFAPVTVAADGSFTLPTNLSSGLHPVSFRATDAWGNTSALQNVRFRIDSIAPTIQLASPTGAAGLTAGARVTGIVNGTGSDVVSISYAWDNGQAIPLSFTATGAFDQSLDLSRLAPGQHTLRMTAQDAAGNIGTHDQVVSLSQATPFQIRSFNPSSRATNVGVTVKPQVLFTRPVNPASLNENNFYATGPSGQKLPATIVPATDGTFAWLFFQDPMPGGATITVHVVGDSIRAQLDDVALDADNDGMAGGTLDFRFTTVPLSGVAGTTLVGVVADPGADLQMGTVDDTRPGPDGKLMTADDLFLRPLANVRVFILGREHETVFTDANGRFELTSLPAGNVKLVVDGLTANNPPTGIYFPEMVMDLYLQPGIANTVMSAMEPDPVRSRAIVGTGVYLPRIQNSILQPVSSTQPTQITVRPEAAPNLTTEQQSYLKIDLPAGGLIGADGQAKTQGQVGISTVPPEMVRDMLPPGILQHTFDITVQSPGIANFASPAPMTFPNVFNAPPGTKLNFLSFDHNTGRLVIEGTVTVSADGKYATTDPGTGITHPGWHGMTPDGGPGCGAPPSPDPDDDQDDDEPPVEDPIEHDPDVDFYVGDAPGEGDGESAAAGDGEGPSTSSFPGATGTHEGEAFRFEWYPPQKPEEEQDDQSDDGGGGGGACPVPNDDDDEDDEENQEKIVIKISITGGLDKWMKKGEKSRPLKSDEITLYPEKDPEKKKVVFAAKLKPFKEMLDELGGSADFPLKDLNENLLYGAEIKLEYKHYNKDGKVDDDHTGYKVLYRFIDATDDKHSDRQMSFEWTTVGAEREKPIVYKDVPGSVRPTMEFDPPDAGFSQSGTNVVFQPTETGFADATLKFKSPRDPSSELTLGLASVGLPKTKLVIDTAPFTQAIIDTYNEFPNWMQDAERAALETVDLSGQRHLDMEKVNLLVQNTVLYVTEKLQPLSESITVTTGAGGGSHTVLANDFHPDAFVDPPPVLKAPIVGFFTTGGNTNEDGGDMQPDAVRKVTTSSHTWSLAERVFHLSNAINLNDTARVYTYIRNFFNANKVGGTPALTFTEMVAAFGKTIAHEFGHTLGLVHTYNSSKKIGFDATDVMRQGVLELTGPAAIDEKFNNLTQAALKIATGATWDLQTEGQDAVELYTNHFKFRQSGGGLNTFDDESPPEEVGPPLDVNDGFLLMAPSDGLGSADAIDFGDVVPGGAGKELENQLINLGNQPLRVNSLRLQGTDRQAFVLTSPATPLVIPPLESRTVKIRYAPEKTGAARAQLVIDSDGLVPRTEITIRGRGQNSTPHLTLDLSRNNAGGVRTDQPAVEVRDMITMVNDGVQPLLITRMAIAEGNSEFSLMQVPEDLANNPLRLNPGESFSIGVKFKPSTLGLRRAAIEIDSNDPDQPTARFFTVGTGLDRFFHGSWGDDFAAFETPDRPNAPILRAVTDPAGRFEIFVPAEQEFHLAIYDPQSGLIAHNYAVTSPSGQRTRLTESMDFRASHDPDSDGDGVPDDIEFAIGSRTDSRDTDKDGLDDFTELAQQLDPVGGRRLPLGGIASAEMQGEAQAVVLAGELNDREGQTAYVATGSFGLAVVDASQFTRPVVLSELDLAGENQDVAIDTTRNLVIVAAGDAGVHLVDVTNRVRPVLQRTAILPDGGQKVEVYGRRIFAASGTAIVEVDAITGEVLQTLELSDIRDLAVSGTTLFVIDGTKLQAIDLDQVRLVKLGSVDLPYTGESVFVGGGIAYVTRPLVVGGASSGGFSTVDVSDPTDLNLISGPDNTDRAPGRVISVNGSGLALVGDANAPTQPGVVQVFDVSDPSQTSALVTQFVLPARVNGMAIASGLGYVADDEEGLKVVNYRDFDVQGNPPEATVANPPADVDSQASGIQLYEGTLLPLQVTTTDDFQVRQVELLLNGQRVGNDVSFPFDFVVPLPKRTAGQTTATLQARATDTGGNQAITDVLTWELIPDVTPPSIVSSNPAAGASAFFIPSILVEWSESIDPALLTATGVHLTYLGPDGVLGSNDDVPVQIGRIDLRNRDRLLTIVPAAPPEQAGLYELSFDAAAVADRVGNHPASALTRRFTLRPASDVRALVGTPAIARAPSANAGQLVGFKVEGADFSMRMKFATRNSFDGAISTQEVFPNDVEGDIIYFTVPTNATTGDVEITGDPNGPFPLQIVPTLKRAEDGNVNGDWIRGDRLILAGSGIQEAATTILIGSLSIVDSAGAFDQLPDVNERFPDQLTELKVPIDAPMGPVVLVTEGGRSNALSHSNRITNITSAATTGTPAVANVAAANPGQAITIQGTNLNNSSLVAFPTMDLGNGEFLRFVQPVWVSENGNEAIVIVPPNAITGDIRLFGDTSNSRARLQVVPVIEGIDFHTLQGTIGQGSIVIARFSGRSAVEDHGTTYQMGTATVVDDGSTGTPDLFAFFADPTNAHTDVRFSTDGDFAGPITITTEGGTSAPYHVQFTALESIAAKGTAADPALPSANPGQVVTVRGSNFKETTDFLGQYTDNNGTLRYQFVNPDFVSEDRTLATIVIPQHFNGASKLRLLGSTFAPTLQIVPLLDDVDVNAVNRIQLHGRGFLEGQNSVYRFAGGEVTDASNSSDPVDVFSHEVENGGVNLTLPRTAIGNLTVTTTGGTSAPLALNFLNPQLGALLDIAVGSYYVATSTRIHRLNESTGVSEFDFAMPGNSSSAFGLQSLASSMSLAGVSVPAGSLLVTNGTPNPDRAYAVNPSNGTILATLDLVEATSENLDVVAGVYHAPSGHLFLLDADPNQLLEVDPNSGSVLNRFPIPFDIGEGGLAIHPTTGNLWVGSDRSDRLGEFRPDGQIVRDWVLPDVGMHSKATGLAFNAAGKLLISSSRGAIYEIDVAPAAPPAPHLDSIQAVAKGGTPANTQLPSANAGETIQLTGQNFRTTTQVVFPIRDAAGRRSSLVVLPTAVSADGTKLQVVVPDQAETGNITIAAFHSPVNLGFNGSWGDSIYRDIKRRFTPQQSTTKIHFTDGGLQELGDESWGLDNVRVAPVGGNPLFTDTFEGGAQSQWTFDTTDNTLPGSLTEFSGRFNNLGQELTLNLTPGQEYELTFDFYALDSWDGTAGPDYFSVLVDGQSIFHETFSNVPQFLQTFGRTDLGSVALQIVPTLTSITGEVGGEQLYTLQGSGFMEAGMSVTVGGRTFTDTFADDQRNLHGDVTGDRNASLNFGQSRTITAPITVTTAGGSDTLSEIPTQPPAFVDLVRVESVAEAGAPLNPQIPSANVGQDIVLVGRAFRHDTIIQFTATDDTGAVGRVNVTGTVSQNGTRLTVRVPTFASTGELRVVGDSEALPIQIVPLVRAVGGEVTSGKTIVLDGAGLVAGETQITIGGQSATIEHIETVYGTVSSFLKLQQQLVDVTVPAAIANMLIVVTTDGGSYSVPLPLSEAVSHLHSIDAVAERGTPRVSDVASAIAGQVITLRGIDLRGADRILFTTPTGSSSQTIAMSPSSVANDGLSLTVKVPESAQTGVVKLERDSFGILLQIVPRVDKVSGAPFSSGTFQLDGGGFAQNSVVIEMDGTEFADTIAGNNTSSSFSQISGPADRLSLRNVVVRTAGGVSALVDTALTQIVSAADRGIPDDAQRPSANPGQTITLKGRGLHAGTGVIFTIRDVGGTLGIAIVRPTTVVNNTEVTVAVPLNAATGPVSLVGDTSGQELTLQVVPLITRADVVSVAGDRFVVTLNGHSYLEGRNTPYTFGNYTRYDTGDGNNFLGIEIKNFFDDKFHFADVPLSLSADVFGPISTHVPGGTAVFEETITGFTSVASTGTPANAGIHSANPGQLVDLQGVGLDKEVEILFRYTDSEGNPRWLAVNPTTVSEDKTTASFAMPDVLNGIVEMHVLGSTFQRTIQIVPVVSDMTVQGLARIRLSGKGFLEGQNSEYDFGGSKLTDNSLTDNTISVIDNFSGGNNLVDITPPTFGFGNLTVKTLGGTSAPFAVNLISTGLGRLYDVAKGIYVATATTIHKLDPATGQSLSSFAIPGTTTTDSVGLQLLDAPIPSLGGVAVPAGSLLITNGKTNPDKIFAVNPADGTIVATLDIPGNLDVVAGVYHAGLNRIFVLDWTPDEVVRLNPETGEVITSFTTPFDVGNGGLAIDPVTANLWIGSSQTSEIAEVNPTGQLQRRVNLAPLGIDGGEISGLAFDAEGKLLVSTVNGFVHRITLPGAGLRLDDALAAKDRSNVAAGDALDAAALGTLRDEAIRRWARTGIAEEQLARLSQIRIVVTDLSGPVLGWTTPDYVALDVNAAGYGWYLDQTPWDDDEFMDSLSGPESDQIDLLSVLAHEFGHLLHGDDHWHDPDLLLTGVRRTP